MDTKIRSSVAVIALVTGGCLVRSLVAVPRSPLGQAAAPKTFIWGKTGLVPQPSSMELMETVELR